MSLADQLITRGWTQGQREDAEGRVCLTGAATYEIAKSFYVPHMSGEIWESYVTFIEVVAAITHCKGVIQWNDDVNRTFDEVLRVAKEADEMIDYLKELNASSQSSADPITGES